MVLLKREEAIFTRNEKGEILPIDMVLSPRGTEAPQGKEPLSVRATPLSSAELIEWAEKRDAKGKIGIADIHELVLKHLKEPVFTKEELSAMKDSVLGAIASAIIENSKGVIEWFR